MTLVTFGLMAMFALVSAVGAFAQEAPAAQVVEAAAQTSQETAATATAQGLSAERAGVQKFGLIAAAIAFGLGAIAAGIAIANVGSAAMGAIGERPEIASQALIFIALAEGLVVFGFITALMILGKV